MAAHRGTTQVAADLVTVEQAVRGGASRVTTGSLGDGLSVGSGEVTLLPAPSVPQDGPVVEESLPALAVREGEEPWTPQEIAAAQDELREELLRLGQEVLVLEANLADVMRESADGAGDDHADTGSKAYGREQELSFLTTTRGTLFQTRHALSRIDNGTYGDCESCHGPAQAHATSAQATRIGISKYSPDLCNQCHDGSRRHSLGTFFHQLTIERFHLAFVPKTKYTIPHGITTS